MAVDVRLCKDCQRTIFSKVDFARELSVSTPDQRAWQNLLQFAQGLGGWLPRLVGELDFDRQIQVSMTTATLDWHSFSGDLENLVRRKDLTNRVIDFDPASIEAARNPAGVSVFARPTGPVLPDTSH